MERMHSSMIPLAIEPDNGSLLGDSFEIVDYAVKYSQNRLGALTDSWRQKLDMYGAAGK